MNKQILVSLKILDPDFTVSLTNIAVMVVIVKIAAAGTLDWPTISSLLLALLAYAHKRQLNSKRASSVQGADSQLADLEKKVTELMTAFNLKKLK